MAQVVMVADVLIAERNPDDPLSDQSRQAVDDKISRAVIDKAAGDPADQFDGSVSMTQQQRSGIRRHRAAFKISNRTAAANAFKFKLLGPAVCRHRRFRLVLLSVCRNFTFADSQR
jgi:hypothetical protein